jgi:hypothetical protein
MRTSNPLITILPAMPPGISEIEHTPRKERSALRVLATLLVLIGLGAALMLSVAMSGT